MDDFCIETFIYERLCRGCKKEKQCHDNCEHCKDYFKELDNYEYDNND